MAAKLRIGVVGCGGIARAHLGGYQKSGEAEIVACYDVRAEAAQQLATAAGAARVAASPAEMIARDRLDAVSVCSPPACHRANCAPFLAAKIPVLCEKPLEVNAATAAGLAADVAAGGTVFMTAFCHRFHPAIIELKRLIDEGVLGEPQLFRNIFGGWNDLTGNHRANPALSGGGCLIDHCCHSMDLFRFLVGDPTHAQAVAVNIAQALPIEDFGMMHLAVDERAFGEITASYSLRVCGNFVEWYGTKGLAVVSYWAAGRPDLEYCVAGGKWTTVDCAAHPDRFAGEIKHFLACVRSRATPAVTVTDGLKANQIAAAVYEAAARHQRVAVQYGA